MICNHPHFSRKRVLKTRYISINVRKCIACWECVSACPQDVLGKITFFAHRHVRLLNPENCKGCLACKKLCPQGAIVQN